MGVLTKEDDATLFRSWFKEMAKLRGFSVKYRYVKDGLSITTHGELNPNDLSDPIDIDIIYEQNPRMKTLRNIGWISESQDDKPYIMMLPFDTPHLSQEARVYIPANYELLTNGFKEFKITSVNMNLEYPDCYICTVVPVFQNDIVKDDYTDDNYNYIDGGV